MTAMCSQSLDELRAGLAHLVETCPADHCNPADCPLFELRTMKPENRLRWFNALKEDELRYLAAYHYVCMNVKLSSSSPSGPKG